MSVTSKIKNASCFQFKKSLILLSWWIILKIFLAGGGLNIFYEKLKYDTQHAVSGK